MNILNLITALLALSLYTGCHLKSADVSVRVLVKTPEGEPVTNADIYIDKQKVGDTNAYGTFTGTFNAKQATVHRIEIRKHNDAYYYAPHLETVTIPKQNRFTWNVTATMYLAPKQKLKSIVNVPPTDDLKTTDQVQPETVAPISLLDATPFILSGSAKVLQLDDGIVGVPSKISFKESTDSLFTIHTFAARSPLEDVEVMACIPGRELQPLCRSNTRGRCTANMSDLSEIDQAALVVRHSGFETATIQGPFERGSNVRVNLAQGKSIDLSAFFEIFGKKIPAQRIAFINKDLPAIIESNSCGFASFKAPPSGSISSAMSLRASHDSVAKGAVELSINRSGSKIVPIQLESATIPDVMIAIERVRPGKGLNQRDAIRYLGLENQARLGNLLLKSLNLPEMNIEAELSSENTNALPHSNRKKSPALKLKLRIYIGVPDRNLVLIGDLQDDSGRIIATTQSSLGDTEIHQNAAIEAISHSVVSFISSGGQHPTMVTPHSISGRWITIEAEPKPTEIAWANGTTHLPFTDAPIDIGNSTQVAIVPPPGYLGVEINLTNARSWIDFSGPNKISLHRDFITNALELAKQGAFEEAIKSLEGVPKSHPQFFDSLVLIAIIEGHQQSKNHATLEAILKHSSESLDSPKTSLSNEQTTNVVIAVNQLIEAQEANAKRRLELAEISIQLVEKILPKLRNENRNDLVKVVLAYQGLAKGIMAGANGDPVLAAESEAALKEVLKLSEGEPISHRSHALKVIATKSLRALDRH